MQISQALALLEISAQSSVNERKQAFEVKRDKLEGQIAQSPTPALKEKFRAKLRELEQAYQLIEQELASDELPVAVSAGLDSNQNQGVTDFKSNSSDFATEHHWKLQVMEELDERFGKTLNSSQLQGYLASCAPQQNLDNLIPLALDKIKKYGKEPLDKEYYKQTKWLQNILFTLFFVNRKDHPAFRELLHQETISGIEALALLCAEKKHFVTPSEEEALHQKRQKIKRAFPKFVAISAVIVLGVIGQSYFREYLDDKNTVEQLMLEAAKLTQQNNFKDAKAKLEKAHKIDVLQGEVDELIRLISKKELKNPLYKISKNDWFASRTKSREKLNWSAIRFQGNTVTLQQDRTDNGPILFSKSIPVLEGKTLRVSRELEIHSAKRRWNGKDNYFTGELSLLGTDVRGNSYLSSNNYTKLCQVGYYNYEYKGDWDNFFLQKNIPKNYVSSTWDKPFTEELLYTPKTGLAIYKKGSETVTAKCTPNTSRFLKVYISTYGWWTGHYTKIYDISVEWID